MMTCRPVCTLLAMLPGLLAPLGCANWQPGCSSMVVMQPAPTASLGAASNELPAEQAAPLCLTIAGRLEEKGYTVEAIQQYEKARAYDPNSTVAHRLAVLYDLQGETSRAEVEYQRALAEQPGDPELHNDLGYFQYRHGRMKLAEEALRRAVAINPGCRCAWINLGRVLARQGRAEESYQAFTRVLRPAEAYSNVGVLLAKQGRTAEARNALRQAVALDPTLEQSRAFLNALPPASPTTPTPPLLPPGLTHGTPLPSPALPPTPPPPTKPVVLRKSAPIPLAVQASSLPEPVIVQTSNVVPATPRTLPPSAPALLPPPAAEPIIVQKSTPPVVGRVDPLLSPASKEPLVTRKSAPPTEPIILTSATARSASMPPPPPPPPPSPKVILVPPAPTPQVTITDCQGEPESEQGSTPP